MNGEHGSDRDAAGYSELEKFLSGLIDSGTIPGLAALVARGEEVLYRFTGGRAVKIPFERPVTRDTIFDCASLTKPLITAPLAARFIERGLLRLEDRLAEHLPELDGTSKADLTIEQLLTHRSGLPAWRPLYIHGQDVKSYLETLARLPLENEPGERTVYSCLDYILIGFILERTSGKDIGRLAREEIFKPLALERTFYMPERKIIETHVAATERGNRFERTMAGSEGESFKEWRGELVIGDVHDCNAFYLKGHSGNAGLFSSCDDLLRYSNELLKGGASVVSPVTRTLLLQGPPGLPGTSGYTVGFEKAGQPGSSAGPSLSSEAVGHSGFTGVSLWIDPPREGIFILLTNRIHPRVTDLNMNKIRRDFHAISAFLL
ncbi:serine hydrolase domain-containing protein [Acidobacteriota bacterium]